MMKRNYIMDVIDNYLDTILSVQLKECGIQIDVCNKVIDNIKNQMLSLLQFWDIEAFRNTILAIGMEEALFYKPSTKIETKCFVVVTIRNSLLETLASDDFIKLGAANIIDDNKIKEITFKAIEYFSLHNLSDISGSSDYTNIDNIYCSLKEKYKSAWAALETIGGTKKKRVRYAKVVSHPDCELIEILNKQFNAEQENIADKKLNKVILSGYDETLDTTLLAILNAVYSKPNFIFVVDCFKMVSRNVKKLFRVMDFILQCDGIIVTSNYYITNGYIEIRRPLIKPAHNSDDMKNNLLNLKGLSAKHYSALKQFSQKN